MTPQTGDLLRIVDTSAGCQLIGEIDSTNADRLRAYLDGRVERDRDFVLDCTELAFMDSSGVHAVLAVAGGMGGGALVFRGCGPSLRRLFEVTGVEELAPVVIE
jgi:anti-anti-sigma factor